MVEANLKKYFQLAREHSNIDLIFPEFLKAELYVVTKGQSSGKPIFFAQQSPAKQGLCITASECIDVFDNVVGVSFVKLSGKELLQSLDPNLGILIVHRDGGDYLDPQQLQWFRFLLQEQ